MDIKTDAWLAPALYASHKARCRNDCRSSYEQRYPAIYSKLDTKTGRFEVKDYLVILEPATDGTWGAYVPDLPGCTSGGRSRDEAALNVRQAIEGHIEVLHDSGQAVPDPVSAAEIVHVA